MFVAVSIRYKTPKTLRLHPQGLCALVAKLLFVVVIIVFVVVTVLDQLELVMFTSFFFVTAVSTVTICVAILGSLRVTGHSLLTFPARREQCLQDVGLLPRRLSWSLGKRGSSNFWHRLDQVRRRCTGAGSGAGVPLAASIGIAPPLVEVADEGAVGRRRRRRPHLGRHVSVHRPLLPHLGGEAGRRRRGTGGVAGALPGDVPVAAASRGVVGAGATG